MKVLYILIPTLTLVLVTVFVFRPQPPNLLPHQPAAENATTEDPPDETVPSMANPASSHCEENGGTLEILTGSDGAQFGMCNFPDYACEEWAFFRGECTVDDDREKIRAALIAKGLDLTGMDITIRKHMGKYISGSVVPVDSFGGGGYVFAAKDNGTVSIVADGNGTIMCSILSEYPDYPSFLIPECIDSLGNPVKR